MDKNAKETGGEDGKRCWIKRGGKATEMEDEWTVSLAAMHEHGGPKIRATTAARRDLETVSHGSRACTRLLRVRHATRVRAARLFVVPRKKTYYRRPVLPSGRGALKKIRILADQPAA